MSTVVMKKNDDIIMRLVHYFITEKDYAPIVVNGVKDEIWLENSEGPFKIIRINSNYIHNNEQFNFDIYKTENVMKQIKKKTMSFSVNILNIFLDINDNVDIKDRKHFSNLKIDTIEDIEKQDIIKEAFPDLHDKLLKDVDGMELIINVTKDINKKTEERNNSYEKTFKPKKIIVTKVLIALCIAMFALTLFAGRGSITNNIFYIYGCNFAPLVRTNIVNVYRFVTCAFLHGSILHLLCNMYALLVIGTQVETFLGKAKFIFIYLISAITGSMLSFVFTNVPSIGASGAIFGLMGSLLYFGYHYRLYIGQAIKSQIIPIIILNLFLGFTFANIDNAAHIGGLVGGYLATVIVGVNEKSTKKENINGLIVLLILWAFLMYVGLFMK
ncbi:MAG: rhomboid family intramembrane serine protease [Bacilli bacterium]